MCHCTLDSLGRSMKLMHAGCWGCPSWWSRKSGQTTRRILMLGLISVNLLSSCSSPPTQRLATISPYIGTNTLQGKYDGVFFDFPFPEGIESTNVSKAVLIVGNRTYNATYSPTNRLYTWYTKNSCEDLPQGTNIPITFQLIDSMSKVLDERIIKLNISTC